MITIEGDYIIFSSGKQVYAEEGVVGIDIEGHIVELSGERTGSLTDQEKWELSRYMIERWMQVRDNLWTEHETYLTKRTTEDLVKISEEIVPKQEGTLCDRDTCDLHRESPNIKGHCAKGLDGRNCPDVVIAKEKVGIRENPAWPARLDVPRCRCNAVPVEEIIEGPVCGDKSCFEHEEMHKDGCALPILDRNQCGTWQSITAAKDKEERVKNEEVVEESVRYSERGAREVLQQQVLCPTCKTETIIGLNEVGPDLWKVVESRYCPSCGWKEGQAIALPKEPVPPKSRDLPTFILGNFEIDPKAKRLHQLAKEYHRRCDDYDNLVCTGAKGPGGGVMPANGEERMKMSINAQEALSTIEEKGRLAGISSSEIMKAIQEVRG